MTKRRVTLLMCQLDVMMELEDGTVPAHRALLMCRSDMMVNMFNLDFSERSNRTVSLIEPTID